MTAHAEFAEELAVFEEHRTEWSQVHPGKFVAIQDRKVAEGFFVSYAEALKAGLRAFGASREFLVKQIWLTEPVYYIS
jgi:hypothetical protein